MTHFSGSTSRSAPPELDFVELRRAREVRDRFAASAGRQSVGRRSHPARPSWVRRLLFLIALSCLGYYAYASGERVWNDYRSSAWLDSQARSAATTSAPTSARSNPPQTDSHPASQSESRTDPIAPPPERAKADPATAETSTALRQLADGDLIGRLNIPALGVEGAVQHGNTSGVLRRAIGHLPGTALPGEGGHVVLAGHRDSFFRGLRRATRGQEITVSTPSGDFVYRIDGLSIVGPRDVEVIAPTHEERLTLVTCYPFDYVGPAPRRFIVTALPVSPAASNLPDANLLASNS